MTFALDSCGRWPIYHSLCMPRPLTNTGLKKTTYHIS